MENLVAKNWDEFKTTITDIELDVLKNAKGNNAAGVRARKGLRLLKTKASELIKLTTEIDKARRSAKT